MDTLNGSDHASMKEIRFKAADGVWRFAFAFDPDLQAVILCGGDKSGISEKRFYKTLIKTADGRFSDWLDRKKRE
ncbi:type II toxin-antitoxin system RelE/ParE family toxin [Phenylobacterium sp.]|uniref:type II toxin-antitoxin system RelE/ParE family toxin n=1 Tax=Phenylobacterium sp. TaxID=1871053 RepID=UPI0025D6B2EF|nr:type II toxin-antitoxin system RelE/ParE family toxin [Phenylobacterium sp.]